MLSINTYFSGKGPKTQVDSVTGVTKRLSFKADQLVTGNKSKRRKLQLEIKIKQC